MDETEKYQQRLEAIAVSRHTHTECRHVVTEDKEIKLRSWIVPDLIHTLLSVLCDEQSVADPEKTTPVCHDDSSIVDVAALSL